MKFIILFLFSRTYPMWLGLGAIYVGTITISVKGQCIGEQELIRPERFALDNFGASVSVDGDTVLVGAPGANGFFAADTGVAYVFQYAGGTWTLIQKLAATDENHADRFGESVALNGDTLVVGAPNAAPGSGNGPGAAYVFVRSGTTWNQQQKLIAPDGVAGDDFGAAVSLSGDTLLIGDHSNDDAGLVNVGSAYVFLRIGEVWTLDEKLTRPGGEADDHFGASVSLSNDVAVVGVPYAKFAPVLAAHGSAVVFARTDGAWSSMAELRASDGCHNCLFGWSVCLSGGTILVGSRSGWVGEPPSQNGSVHVFDGSGGIWVEKSKLTASDGSEFDNFGESVSMSGDLAVVGAPRNDDGCPSSDPNCDLGSAYIFRRSAGAWSEIAKLTTSTGSADDSFGNSVSISETKVVVGARWDDFQSNSNAGSAFAFQCVVACSPPDCNGNGTCKNGGCVCNSGYTGSACDQCAPTGAELPGSTCADGLDNDCDGATDCVDPDCAADSVACPAGQIPAVSEWGLIALGLLTMTMGTILVRRSACAA